MRKTILTLGILLSITSCSQNKKQNKMDTKKVDNLYKELKFRSKYIQKNQAAL